MRLRQRARSAARSVLPWLAAGLVAISAAAAATPPGGAERPVAGVTRDARGHAVPGVEIRVAPVDRNGAVTVLRTQSDATGHFAVASLAPGAYRVVAFKGGYAVVVAQINTIVQDTLEVVLHPAGTPAGPGTRPEDAGWTLRLPRRDVLEQREARVQDAQRDQDPRPENLAPFFSVEALTTRVSDDAAHGTGNVISLAGLMAAGSFGAVSGRFLHSDDGAAESLHDRTHALRLRWLPRSEDGDARRTVSVDLVERTTEFNAGGAFEDGPRLAVGGVALRAGRAHRGDDGSASDIGIELVGAGYDRDGFDAFGGTNFGVVRLAGQASYGRTVTGDHDLALLGSAAITRGALREGRLAALPAGTDPAGSLAEAASDRVTGTFQDTWRVAPDLALISRATGDWTRFGAGRARGAATLGVRWDLTPYLQVLGEGGFALGGAVRGQGLGGLTLRAQAGPVAFSAARRHELAALGAQAATPVTGTLLGGPDALQDIWSAALTWHQVAGTDVRLTAEWVAIEGSLAPRLPVDLGFVPVVTDGRAAGRRWDLELTISATGTSLDISLQDLADRGGGTPLLEGAERWDRRALTVRQRLTSRDRDGGAACYLVLAAEANRLDPAPAQPERDPLRLALLQRHRLSGGMALTF